jgi:hypothetical protein
MLRQLLIYTTMSGELNVATARMIKGECRVIPVVIDETPFPAEVIGLFYADCRKGLARVLPSILTALQHEARRADMEHSFSSRVDRLVDEIFGGRSSVGTTEYRGPDWRLSRCRFLILMVTNETPFMTPSRTTIEGGAGNRSRSMKASLVSSKEASKTPRRISR